MGGLFFFLLWNCGIRQNESFQSTWPVGLRSLWSGRSPPTVLTKTQRRVWRQALSGPVERTAAWRCPPAPPTPPNPPPTPSMALCQPSQDGRPVVGPGLVNLARWNASQAALRRPPPPAPSLNLSGSIFPWAKNKHASALPCQFSADLIANDGIPPTVNPSLLMSYLYLTTRGQKDWQNKVIAFLKVSPPT